MDDNARRTRAALTGNAGYGRVANARTMERWAEPLPSKSRRRCYCGCGTRATHVGVCNGLGMMTGCHFSVLQWVRDPMAALRAWRERKGEK